MNCDRKDRIKLTEKKWYYDDGNLKKVQEYINDSIENGTYLFYYPNGILQDSAQILLGMLHGDRFEYYNSGELYTLTRYCFDKFRNAIFYRRNGTIEYYRAYSYGEELCFELFYPKGKKSYELKGSPIYTAQLDDSTHFDTFEIKLLVAQPPNSTVKVLIRECDSLGGSISKYKNHRLNDCNEVSCLIRKNTKKDIYIENIATIKNPFLNYTLNDTVYLKINRDGEMTYLHHLN